MRNPLSLTSLGYPPTRAQFDTKATFVRSHFASPFAYAAIRSVAALYCWVALIVAYSWLSQNWAPNTLRDIKIPTYTLILGKWFIAKSFSYFTFLTFWSQSFYFTVSAWHTFTYARNQRLKAPRTSHLHDTFPPWLQLAHSIWYTTITTYPFLVSIVFWGSMYGPPWPDSSPFTQWVNLSVHALNSVFATTEIILSAVPPPPFLPHLLPVLLLLSLYLGVAYITKAHQNFYVYEWMNPAHGWQNIVAHVFSYAGLMVAIYTLVWVAAWARERWTSDPPAMRALVVRKWYRSSKLEDEESDSSKPSTSSSSRTQSSDGGVVHVLTRWEAACAKHEVLSNETGYSYFLARSHFSDAASSRSA